MAVIERQASARLGRANSTKIGTPAVQYLAYVTFAKFSPSPAMTPLSAYFTCAELLTVLLGLRRFEATHNPLVLGSNPCGPTTFKAAHCAAFHA